MSLGYPSIISCWIGRTGSRWDLLLSEHWLHRPLVDVDAQFKIKKHQGPAKASPPEEVRSDAGGHWAVVKIVNSAANSITVRDRLWPDV